MYRSRWNYWSCSKVADYIRGTNKPFALGSSEWDEWNDDAKKKHPIRYYLAETGLNVLQDIIYFPYDVYHTVEVYVRNRWIDKTHIIKTGLEPGQYHEFDTKILHGVFNELVDYVESELAHTMKCYEDKNYKFKNGRCKQAGLDHLDWAIGLTYGENYGMYEHHPDYNKPTRQAISAMAIKELYLWWTEKRPNRPDLDNLSFDEINQIEIQYDQEDTDMLIKLICIRKEIWC